jgi:hypothetical protein
VPVFVGEERDPGRGGVLDAREGCTAGRFPVTTVLLVCGFLVVAVVIGTVTALIVVTYREDQEGRQK